MLDKYTIGLHDKVIFINQAVLKLDSGLVVEIKGQLLKIKTKHGELIKRASDCAIHTGNSALRRFSGQESDVVSFPYSEVQRALHCLPDRDTDVNATQIFRPVQ